MDYGEMDLQIFQSNNGEMSWFWLIGEDMVESATVDKNYWPPEVEYIVLFSETVWLSTQ